MKIYSMNASPSGIFNLLSKDKRFALGLESAADLENILDSTDPTAEKNNYLYAYIIIDWLFSLFLDSQRNGVESDKDLADIYGVSRLNDLFEDYFDYLTKFEIMRNRGVIKGKPKVILKNKSFKDLKKNVDSLWKDEYAEVSVNWSKANNTEGWSRVYGEGSYKVYEITSVPAARIFGKGSSWCFGRADNYAKRYAVEYGPLYIVYKNGKHYMAICNLLSEWKTVDNIGISIELFVEVYPFIKDIIHSILYKGDINGYHLYILTPNEVLGQNVTASTCYDYLVKSGKVEDPKPFIEKILKEDPTGELIFEASCLKEPFDMLSIVPIDTFKHRIVDVDSSGYWIYRFAKYHSLGADKFLNNFVGQLPDSSPETVLWKTLFSRLDGSYLLLDNDIDKGTAGLIKYAYDVYEDDDMRCLCLREILRDHSDEVLDRVYSSIENGYDTPAPLDIDGREILSGTHYDYYGPGYYMNLDGYIRFFSGDDFRFILDELFRRFDMSYTDGDGVVEYQLPEGISIGNIERIFNGAAIFNDYIVNFIDDLSSKLGRSIGGSIGWGSDISIEKLFTTDDIHKYKIELNDVGEFDTDYASDSPEVFGLYGIDSYIINWEFNLDTVRAVLPGWVLDNDFYILLDKELEEKSDIDLEDLIETASDVLIAALIRGDLDADYPDYESANPFYKVTDTSQKFLDTLDSELDKFYKDIKNNIDPYVVQLRKVINFDEILMERDQLKFNFGV